MRRLIAVPVVIAAAAFAGVAIAEDDAASAITPEAAKASVERSAQLRLAPQKLPAEAREQGLEAAYSNPITAAYDRQAVAVFLMKDAGVADKVGDLVRDAVAQPSRLIVNDNVVVVYAAAGRDRSAQVEQAIQAL